MDEFGDYAKVGVLETYPHEFGDKLIPQAMPDVDFLHKFVNNLVQPSYSRFF
eukprot:CAMPEP_0197541390 /NCGR_PEP_ID=MMETSP1318-20131121/67131_2 /TAXON_ID=552666 /ORGANISM="Partenskyella glossopodia, Strain RCC365" /LENGTH=51 /DNA_ID=CAMNT_0043100557 /DNA_START=2367 /DNA_END=2522 /DNA_ORIENTATION=-